MELNSQGSSGSEETGLCSLFHQQVAQSPQQIYRELSECRFSPTGPSDHSFLVGFAFSCSVKGHLPGQMGSRGVAAEGQRPLYSF